MLLIISQHIPREIEKKAADKMTIERTKEGWMDGEVFVRWLQNLGDGLDQPTLLLMDSAASYNNIDMRDPFGGVPWRHLHIRWPPVNSTSVTQPLDAGVISAFKRVSLEMISFETYYARNFDDMTTITNGRAWSLVPYSVSQLPNRIEYDPYSYSIRVLFDSSLLKSNKNRIKVESNRINIESNKY
jgi:hypothetical protein